MTRQSLSDVYVDKYKISSIDENVELNIEEFFVNLEVVEIDPTKKDETSRKIDPYSNRDKIEGRRKCTGKFLQPNQIISSFNKNVLVIGSPGTGKSTLCKKIVYDFYNSNLWAESFDDIVWIQLGALNTIVIEKVKKKFRSVEEENQYYENEILRELFGRYIFEEWNDISKVLYILDGLDEVQDIYKNESKAICSRFLDRVKRRPNVIVTSRPCIKLNFRKYNSVAEIRGFSEIHVRKYIRNILKQTSPECFVEKEEQIVNYINQSSVSDLVTIPILLDIFLYTWDSIELSDKNITMSKLYRKLVIKLWLKFIKAVNIPCDDIKSADLVNICGFVPNECKSLCYMASQWITDGKLDFRLEDCKNMTDEEKKRVAKTPFLNRINPKEENWERQIFEFSHLTILEFFVAFHVLNNLSEAEMCEFVRLHKHNQKFTVVFSFMAGLIVLGVFNSNQRNNEVPSKKLMSKKLHSYYDYLESEPYDLGCRFHYKLLLNCFNECSYANLIDEREYQIYDEMLAFVESYRSFLSGVFQKLTPKLFGLAVERYHNNKNTFINFKNYPPFSDETIGQIDELIEGFEDKVKMLCSQDFLSDATISLLQDILDSEEITLSFLLSVPKMPFILLKRCVEELIRISPPDKALESLVLAGSEHLPEEQRTELLNSFIDNVDLGRPVDFSQSRSLSLEQTKEICQLLVEVKDDDTITQILIRLIQDDGVSLKILAFLRLSFESMEIIPKLVEELALGLEPMQENSVVSIRRLISLLVVFEIMPSESMTSWLIDIQDYYPSLRTLVWYTFCYPPLGIDTLSPEISSIFAYLLEFIYENGSDEVEYDYQALNHLLPALPGLPPPERKLYSKRDYFLFRFLISILKKKKLSNELIILAKRGGISSFYSMHELMDFMMTQIHDETARKYIFENPSTTSKGITEKYSDFLRSIDTRFSKDHMTGFREYIRKEKLYECMGSDELFIEFERFVKHFWSKSCCSELLSACKKYVASKCSDKKYFEERRMSLENVNSQYKNHVEFYCTIFPADHMQGQLLDYLGVLLVLHILDVKGYIDSFSETAQDILGFFYRDEEFLSDLSVFHTLMECVWHHTINISLPLCQKLNSADPTDQLLGAHYYFLSICHLGHSLPSLIENLTVKNFQLVFPILARTISSGELAVYVNDNRICAGGSLNSFYYHSQKLEEHQISMINYKGNAMGLPPIDRNGIHFRVHAITASNSKYLGKWAVTVRSLDEVKVKLLANTVIHNKMSEIKFKGICNEIRNIAEFELHENPQENNEMLQNRINEILGPIRSVTELREKFRENPEIYQLVSEDEINDILEDRDILFSYEIHDEHMETLPHFLNEIKMFNTIHREVALRVELLSPSPFHFNLSNLELRDKDLVTITDLLENNGEFIHTLIFSNNRITSKGFSDLMESVLDSNVRHLLLDKNHIHFDETEFKRAFYRKLATRDNNLETLDLSYNFIERKWIDELISSWPGGAKDNSFKDFNGTVVKYLRLKSKCNLIYERTSTICNEDENEVKFPPALWEMREKLGIDPKKDYISHKRGCIAWAEKKVWHWYSGHLILIIERVKDGQRELTVADLVVDQDADNQCKVRCDNVDPFQHSIVNMTDVSSLQTKLKSKYKIPKIGYASDREIDILFKDIQKSGDSTVLKTYSVLTLLGGVNVNCVQWVNDMLEPIVKSGVCELRVPSIYKFINFVSKYIDSIFAGLLVVVAIFIAVVCSLSYV